MEAVSQPEVVEEVPMYHIKPGRFLPVARKAIEKLQWLVVSEDAHTILCQTPGTEYAPGEQVLVTQTGKHLKVRSIALSGYYADEAQHLRNAERFKHAIKHVIDEDEKDDRNLHPMNRERFGALLISKSYVVTPVLVYINALIFVAMVIAGLSPIAPTAKSLWQWGGNFRPGVVDGEWWRLFSYMFLHGGALHLLMNTYALLHIGMFLEPLMGRFRFASAYVLTGICAGVLSIVMHPFSVGVGASGAIFGMYGIFLSMLTTSHIQKTMRKTMLRSILFFVVYNLMAGLQGNTDNAAHIGGLLSGFAMGYVYYPGIRDRAATGRQVLTTAIIAVVIVAVLAVGLPMLKM